MLTKENCERLKKLLTQTDRSVCFSQSPSYFAIMTDPCHRKKQPELVRESLIEAAKQLTLEHGWGNFSLDAAAKIAGVSKGGLIHHFPNKQALLDALSEHLTRWVQNHVEQTMAGDKDPQGRFVRAYLSIFRLPDDDLHKKLLLVACMTAPHDERAHRRWHDWVDAKMIESRCYVRDMIVKFAADGLWINTLLGEEIDPAMRDAVIERLIDYTKTKEEPLLPFLPN